MDLFQKKFFTKFKVKQYLPESTQLTFLKRLYRLLDNGYSLISALEAIKWDKSMEDTVVTITNHLKEGKHIDVAFHEATFHESIVSYLYFVRINGDLQKSITKCIEMFEQRITYKKKFSQVLRYPLILSIIFLTLLIFIKTSILPSFMDLFQMNLETSKTVLVSITIIDVAITLFIILICLFTIAVCFWIFFRHQLSIEQKINIYTKIPIYNYFLTLQTSFYFATHFSMFLKAGMSFKDILDHMGKQMKLPIIAFYAQRMTEQLGKGLYVTYLLESFPLLEKRVAQIFHKNNNDEALEQDLRAYADILAETFQTNMLRIMAFIQPVFFVVLACFIIFIYVTLMWPMFEFIQSI